MSFSACRDLAFWDDHFEDVLDCDDDLLAQSPKKPLKVPLKPVIPYTNRTAMLKAVVDGIERARTYASADSRAPTEKAKRSAELFINKLSEACLNFDFAIARSGEINFFFGSRQDPAFQLVVDSRGLLSYYGEVGNEELAGDEEAPEQFTEVRLYNLLLKAK